MVLHLADKPHFWYTLIVFRTHDCINLKRDKSVQGLDKRLNQKKIRADAQFCLLIRLFNTSYRKLDKLKKQCDYFKFRLENS